MLFYAAIYYFSFEIRFSIVFWMNEWMNKSLYREPDSFRYYRLRSNTRRDTHRVIASFISQEWRDEKDQISALNSYVTWPCELWPERHPIVDRMWTVRSAGGTKNAEETATPTTVGSHELSITIGRLVSIVESSEARRHIPLRRQQIRITAFWKMPVTKVKWKKKAILRFAESTARGTTKAQTRRNVPPTTNWPQKNTICRYADKGCIAEGRDAFLFTNGIAVSWSTTTCDLLRGRWVAASQPQDDPFGEKKPSFPKGWTRK